MQRPVREISELQRSVLQSEFLFRFTMCLQEDWSQVEHKDKQLLYFTISIHPQIIL